MCDVVSAITGVSAIVGMVGQKRQYAAQRAQSEREAEIARKNAELVDLQIKDAHKRGADKQRDVKRNRDQTIGQQRAATAGNNVDVSYGSPLDLVYETQRLAIEDATAQRRNTQNEVRDLERQKLNYNSAASGASAAADNYGAAGNIAAIGSILGGAGQIARYRASIV